MTPSSPAPRRPALVRRLGRWAMHTPMGSAAVAYGVARWLTGRRRSRPRLTPSDFGLGWQWLRCRTQDGIRLRGWLVEPPRPRGTVALFHGFRKSRAQMLTRLALLLANGYRCVAFDHRAHGQSRGKISSFGYHERHDVTAVAECIAARWPDEPRFALGVSMGAAALTFAAGQGPPWQRVVLESLYRDIASTFESRIGKQFPLWFADFLPGIIRMAERRLKLTLSDIAPLHFVDRFRTTPVLFVAGDNDINVPPEQTQELYERCPAAKALWLVPGAGHHNVFEQDPDEYARRVLAFLSGDEVRSGEE